VEPRRRGPPPAGGRAPPRLPPGPERDRACRAGGLWGGDGGLYPRLHHAAAGVTPWPSRGSVAGPAARGRDGAARQGRGGSSHGAGASERGGETAGPAGVRPVSGPRLAHRPWPCRECQDAGGRAAADRRRDARGADAGQSDGGAARHGLQRPVAGGLAATRAAGAATRRAEPEAATARQTAGVGLHRRADAVASIRGPQHRSGWGRVTATASPLAPAGGSPGRPRARAPATRPPGAARSHPRAERPVSSQGALCNTLTRTPSQRSL
jgi:hypothetical protein